VKESTAEANPRYVGRNVVDKFSVTQCRAGAGGEVQRAGVDSGNETAAKKDASRFPTIEVVCNTYGGDKLHEKEAYRQANAFPN
jgi:hypothetical protein